MKHILQLPKPSLPASLCLLLFFYLAGPAVGQTPCNPSNPNLITSNPGFPVCQTPSAAKFNLLLVLDESGSISPVANTVETAVNDFAARLHNLFPNNTVQMGIVEFSTNAAIGLSIRDVSPNSFLTDVSSYLGPGYQPSGSTDFVDALNLAKTTAHNESVDIIFFMTDGIPDQPDNQWRDIANQIKCDGTYIFAIGVGSGPNASNLQNLSGTDLLGSPGHGNLFEGADYTLTSFGDFGQLLKDLAEAIVDRQSPKVTCPSSVYAINKPGVCGANVDYVTTVDDNCNYTLVCTPPPGSLFPIGQTMVTCTASDNAGNKSTCTFKVNVTDLEAPNMVCPANQTISCEAPSDPSILGTPVALDNCSIQTILHDDVRVNGVCANDFTIQRTWTAVDASGNMRTCLQTIKVTDLKQPVITCPVNITVDCDTSVAKTGVATAIDNCTPRPDISRSDVHISGDCEWMCVTDRTWVAKDECNNTSQCVQRITKDVTPLIEQALAGGPLKLGQGASTVTLEQGHGNCVVQWFPYSGTVPKALTFDNAMAGADCKLMSNPMDANGHLVNPLLGETIKLSLLVRLNPVLGTKKLSSFPCTLPMIVKQALAPNPDVNELVRVTSLTLGNANVNLNVPAHALMLLNYIKCITGGFTVCKPN